MEQEADTATALRLMPVLSTHQGMRRGTNQDAIGYHYPSDPVILHEYGALFVVADGVAGLTSGDIASQTAVAKLLEFYYKTDPALPVNVRLGLTIELVNEAVYALPQECATTLVTALFVDNVVVVASVGDSMIYRVRGDSIERLAREDVLVEPWEDAKRGRLTRAIGYQPRIAVNPISVPIVQGDRILLCSDGVTRYLSDDYLRTLALMHDPKEAVGHTVNSANHAGGADNISIALIRVDEPIADEDVEGYVEQLDIVVEVDAPPDFTPDETKPATQLPSSLFAGGNTPSPVIRASKSPSTPEPESEKPKRSMGIIIGGFLAALLLISGGIIIVTSLPFSAGAVPVATSQPTATEVQPTLTPIPTTAVPPTATTVPTAAPTMTSGPIENGQIETGSQMQLSRSVVVRVQVSSTIAAFVTTPERTYTVQERLTDSEGTQWYRLQEDQSERTGWISEADLPNYTVWLAG